MKMSLKNELLALILDLPEVEERKSRFSQARALFVGTKEIGHFHSANEIDIRLTRPLIAKLGLIKSDDPRLVPGRKGSDWIAVRFRGKSDLKFVAGLVESAASAHRSH